MFEQYPDIVSINHVMEMLNIGKTTAYSLLKANQIRHVKIGRKYIVPKKSIIDFVSVPCYTDADNQWQAH